MSWVTIDRDKCNDCGLCALRCLLVFRKEAGGMTARADESNCNLCGHCISLCPKDAIAHSELDMSNFAPVAEGIDLEPERFLQFIRKRRSVRHFKQKPVGRAELEQLLEACRYAPTGSNRQQVCVKIIQDPATIKSLSDHTVDYFLALIKQFEDEMSRLEAEGKPVPEEVRSLYSTYARYKPMGLARQVGLDVILYQAPAVMVFHAPQTTSTPKDDCVIAAHTAVMTAMTLGLGTCYIGLLTIASHGHPPIQKLLALPAGHKVYSVLVLGYPRLKFLRTVDRKPLRVSWE